MRSAPGDGTTVSAELPLIRILLADDHPVVREGLRGMLAAEPDIDVVGAAASGAEAIALCRSLAPDVILMDLRMPDGDGAEAIGTIRAEREAVRIIVLTTYDTDADILRAVESGASGYLLKDTPRADLLQAIRAPPAARPCWHLSWPDGSSPGCAGPAPRP